MRKERSDRVGWNEKKVDEERKWRVKDESQGRENEAENARVRGAEQTLNQIGLLTSINFTLEVNLISHEMIWNEIRNLSFRQFFYIETNHMESKVSVLGYNKKSGAPSKSEFSVISKSGTC